ncbi:TPA: hypothetical protein DIU27_02530 [Candidatus Collierbacteria bacterium]|nr:MAG: hypothetical protein UW42_C0009G0004 [Candidatus Collierbacteria bacterium GW2011_GWB1_44_197]KKT69056.1 MAG: hypothetical protein UW64_C0005G0017 [Microgenomates group bacterium GW2011_GWC1_44_37]HCQ31232.1 hypothetical protein [Candidatus Collierbacteria bacterium]
MDKNAQFQVIRADSADQLNETLDAIRVSLLGSGRKISAVQMVTPVQCPISHKLIWSVLITHVPFHSLGE